MDLNVGGAESPAHKSDEQGIRKAVAMSSPTIQQLANELGVHKATVSRALSGKPGVSDGVRRRILEAADQRGFFPNGQARSLATSRTETIALVFCDETSEFLTNPFYSKVLAGIAAETAKHEFSLAFCSLLTARCRKSCGSGARTDTCSLAIRTTR
jgi:DNA-binding LacI/PurR family transcriptional regulator